ncbi:RidA family protein [Alloyangia pacifica]|uniref:Enamine deaminase RidA, house cleaning of reactive enamine intermediates, YjgF/YER057c/UK114 family n=1 Tax=Alloyangia pacifica TaxID=311180 RepID=A0A1I6UHX4_9RHOB|nr:RidA family protein [Alloyangia pacifica]SDH70691.1 Enamine deaminase RidA, house cleaning of reactive enamine intermediates, YjgF/YER057c/UK114 family [Alloyangia pacifica]SFT01045.1 Enamine deaminase RidA, house cleaning of reactive enamine intermediates, YjgF/YER057c/UK114 family [Alloyangia pacifica]
MTALTPHMFLQPDGWVPAKGYANGMLAEGRMVFTGGLVGWNAQQEWEHTDMVGQFRQTLENIVAVLDKAGARPEHLVRLTWYITDKQEYLDNLRAFGAAYRDVIGRHFPAMAVVQVCALMEDAAKVEIEATAVIPHG